YYFKTGNYDEAEKYILQAYRASNEDPEIAGHLGMLYYKKKDYAQAVKFFEISKNEKYEKLLNKSKKKAGKANVESGI
ncbi:MAG: tetratricopeptide repeat protein, partial [Elusimicrobium sp.]|nr:tetratricopeptide repeat protein [Elusimicrobium sp.]